MGLTCTGSRARRRARLTCAVSRAPFHVHVHEHEPSEGVADLTAQEAAIPHPNEMGLLGGFVRSLEAAAGKAGQMLKTFLAKAGNKLRAAKEQVRKYRLFAKDKTKAAKDKMVVQMASIVAGINLRSRRAPPERHGRQAPGAAQTRSPHPRAHHLRTAALVQARARLARRGRGAHLATKEHLRNASQPLSRPDRRRSLHRMGRHRQCPGRDREAPAADPSP